jgi:hypothetical protein
MNDEIPDHTLQDKVRFLFVYDCEKHGLAPDSVAYADEKIDRMSNSEFLEALSQALEEIRA